MLNIDGLISCLWRHKLCLQAIRFAVSTEKINTFSNEQLHDVRLGTNITLHSTIAQSVYVLACTYPKPWLLSRALLGSQEENQPVYCSWLEQVIWSGLTDPASKPRGLW